MRRDGRALCATGRGRVHLPSADDDRRDAIADQIGQRPALTHKFVDADNDGKRRNRKVRDDRQGRSKGDETRTGDARRALRVRPETSGRIAEFSEHEAD